MSFIPNPQSAHEYHTKHTILMPFIPPHPTDNTLQIISILDENIRHHWEAAREEQAKRGHSTLPELPEVFSMHVVQNHELIQLITTSGDEAAVMLQVTKATDEWYKFREIIISDKQH